MALKLPFLRFSNNSIDLFKAQQGKSLMTMGLQCQPAVNHVYSNSRQQRVVSGSLSAGSLLALTTACCSLSEAFAKRTRAKDSSLFLSFFISSFHFFLPSFLLFVQSTDAVSLTAWRDIVPYTCFYTCSMFHNEWSFQWHKITHIYLTCLCYLNYAEKVFFF